MSIEHIQPNTVVTIHYVLTNDAGDILDSSQGDEPLQYLHGADNIIPGLEAELAGKRVGDHISAVIEPENAYGPYQESLTQWVPRDLFQGIDTIEPGMQFQAQTDAGVQVVTVADVRDNEVRVDGNHPLAGQRLHFEVDVVAIREATADELSHGHVHGEGGCA